MNWPTIPPILLSSFKLGAGSKLDTAPDGSQVLNVGYGSIASVDLGITPAQLQAYPPGTPPYAREGLYTLTFEAANFFPNYPGEYDIEIDFGTQKFAELYGWGQNLFTTVTMTCPSPAYLIIDQALPGGGPVQGAKDFTINIFNSSWPLMLKNLSLTFTPTN